MVNLALGTMTFGDSADQNLSEEIVNIAYESGITHIDTANMYAGSRSEEIIGKILQKNPGKFQIASKVGNPAGPRGDGGPLSMSSIKKSVEASLQKLQVEALDLLYFHQPDRSTPLEESLEAIHELYKAGKIKRFGLSNYSSWQIQYIIQHCTEQGYIIPDISQQLYNLLSRRVETEYAEYAAVTGLETIVYNPLAGGLLARVLDQNVLPDTGRFDESAQGLMYRDRYWNTDQFSMVQRLNTLAEDAGMTLLELSFRWLLNQPLTQGILIGGSQPEQIRQNVAAIQAGPLPEDLAVACSETTESLLGVAPHYNR